MLKRVIFGLIAALAFLTLDYVIMALAETDDTECIINVTGQQWWWEIDYPVQDGCGDGISSRWDSPSRLLHSAAWSISR